MIAPVRQGEPTRDWIQPSPPKTCVLVHKGDLVALGAELRIKIGKPSRSDAQVFADVLRGLEFEVIHGPARACRLGAPRVVRGHQPLHHLRSGIGKVRRFADVGRKIVKFPIQSDARLDQFPWAFAHRPNAGW
jgi:hypothetical protein